MSLVYFALWVIFNGRLTLEIAAFGVIIAAALDLFVRRVMGINLTWANFVKFIKIIPDVIVYLVVLLVEIFRANFAVTKLVLAHELVLEPCLVKFSTPLKTEGARVALANSITLTPGTITVSLEGPELLVHALNRDIAEGLEGSIFERLLSRMEAKLHV